MAKVLKTTFEEEQEAKEEAWLALTPFERWERAYNVRKMMYKPGVDYSFAGKKVTKTIFEKHPPRTYEQSLIDRYDVEVLKKILKRKEQ